MHSLLTEPCMSKRRAMIKELESMHRDDDALSNMIVGELSRKRRKEQCV